MHNTIENTIGVFSKPWSGFQNLGLISKKRREIGINYLLKVYISFKIDTIFKGLIYIYVCV